MKRECSGRCAWDWPDDLSDDGPAWPDFSVDMDCPLHGRQANTVVVMDAAGERVHIESADARCMCGQCHASKQVAEA